MENNKDPCFLELPAYNFKDKEKNIQDRIREMLNTTISAFKYVGMPEKIVPWKHEWNLQIGIPEVIFEHNGELYATRISFTGRLNYNYLPYKGTISNPYIGETGVYKTVEFNKDAILCRNDPQLVGLFHNYARYATLLTENDITLYMSSVNTRQQNLYKARNDSEKEAAIKYQKDIENGELSAMVTDTFMDIGIKVENMQQQAGSNLYTQLCEYDRYLRNSLAQMQGLGATTNLKRENISENESKQDDDVLLPDWDLMLETRKEDMQKVNDLFGTNITVEFSSAWKDRRKTIEISMANLEQENG